MNTVPKNFFEEGIEEGDPFATDEDGKTEIETALDHLDDTVIREFLGDVDDLKAARINNNH